MVDATELRIGNWVYNEVGIPDQITWDWFSAYGMKMSTVGKENPIPLTHEILEACGFKQERKSVPYFKIMVGELLISCRLDFNTFCVSEGKHDMIEMPYKIEHLHQLQNLFFALTGQELEINSTYLLHFSQTKNPILDKIGNYPNHIRVCP